MIRTLHRSQKLKTKLFSTQPTQKMALLYPSDIPVFRFQTYASTLRNEEAASLRSLNFNQAAVFWKKNNQPIPENFQELIKKAKEKTKEMQKESKSRKSQSSSQNSDQNLSENSTLPELRRTDPSHILGQGLALTTATSMKEFYSEGKIQ